VLPELDWGLYRKETTVATAKKQTTASGPFNAYPFFYTQHLGFIRIAKDLVYSMFCQFKYGSKSIQPSNLT
jgi:hypothetical protein